MSDREHEVELPRLSSFEQNATITVNGGHHRVTGTTTDGEMNVVELGERGDHPHMELRWFPGTPRALLRRLEKGQIASEHPVEQFALGEVNIYDHPDLEEPRVGL